MFKSMHSFLRKLAGIREKAKMERETSGEEKGIRTKLKAEKTLFVMAALLVVVRIVVSLGGPSKETVYVPLKIGNTPLYLEYVSHKGESQQGLKKRPGLASNSGMLFDLSGPQKISVTMKQVNFPLKVVTLNPSMIVLEVETLQPGQEDKAFDQVCRYFLEVNPEIPVLPGDTLQEFTPEGLSLQTRSLVPKGVF